VVCDDEESLDDAVIEFELVLVALLFNFGSKEDFGKVFTLGSDEDVVDE